MVKLSIMAMSCLFACCLAACVGNSSSNVQIQVENAWVWAANRVGEDQGQGDMAAMNGGTSAVYLTIRNTGRETDRLLHATSDAAHAIEFHQTVDKDGVISMIPIDTIDIPKKGSVELEPGGFHMMLVGLTRDLIPGEKILLNLNFEKAGEIKVDAEVRSP